MNLLIDNNKTSYSITTLDSWMEQFFSIFNINTHTFKFDKINKFNKINYKKHDILLFRFEDLDYIIKNIHQITKFM